MKRNISMPLLGLFIGFVFSTQAFSLILYDDFSGTYIDESKWTLGERVREIRDGKLIFEQRTPNPIEIGSYPYVDTVPVAFKNPNSVNSIQTDVTLVENTITNNGYTRARIYGRWYNDGSPGGGMTGDILAEISLRNGPDGLRGNWGVVRYKNSAGTDYEVLKGGNFTTPISVGSTYTLFIAYNSGAHRFVFRLGSEEKSFGPTDLPARAGIPGDPLKALTTRVEVSDDTSSGFISATFDNVNKNDSLYDDFSSSIIDEAKWTDYELVREISGGELRSAVRSSSGNNSSIFNRLAFVDPSSINVIQAKVTPVAYENEEGLNIVARIGGNYFNDGTPGGGSLGEVGAEVFIGGFNGEANPAAGWAVWTYADFEGNHPTLIETGNFSKPISLGDTYTLLIGWTGSNFIFRIDDEEARYVPATAINPPNEPWKEIATRIMTPAGKEAMMEALFDHVMVAASCCPYIDVNPLSIDFGNVSGGSTSDQTVTVTNVGSADLILGTIGSPSAPFSIAGGTCTNSQTLAPSGSCSLIIRFAPTTSGAFTSSFSIPSDALAESNVPVNLTGGSGPDLTGEWSSLTQVCKPSKKGNQCSITGTFIVKNIGKNIAASSNVNFYLSEDNAYDEGDTFLKKVAAGKLKVNASKTIKLTYKLQLPLGNTASGKYVIAVVDADNTVVEADESNNTIAYKIP
jgi:hypothetical protein